MSPLRAVRARTLIAHGKGCHQQFSCDPDLARHFPERGLFGPHHKADSNYLEISGLSGVSQPTALIERPTFLLRRARHISISP